MAHEISEYKIIGLVDPHFQEYCIHNLDFRRHLHADVALEKDVTYLANGRPSVASYSWHGEEMCQLRWTFTNQTDSDLMASRKEEVAYILLDGSLGDWFVIKDDTYDMSKQHHRKKVLDERVDGRAFILNDVKAVVLGTLQAYNPTKTEMEVVEMGAAYWKLHSAALDSFLNTGSKVIVTDTMNDSVTTWLDTIMSVGPPVVTLRDYVANTLNY